MENQLFILILSQRKGLMQIEAEGMQAMTGAAFER